MYRNRHSRDEDVFFYFVSSLHSHFARTYIYGVPIHTQPTQIAWASEWLRGTRLALTSALCRYRIYNLQYTTALDIKLNNLCITQLKRAFCNYYDRVESAVSWTFWWTSTMRIVGWVIYINCKGRKRISEFSRIFRIHIQIA